MGKRTSAYPNRRSSGEMRLNSQRKYNQIVKDAEKHPSKINPVWLEDNYGVREVVKKC